ncbi:TetR family transcriptional regulator [Novosphingobium sediminis]|uniref:TetR family transcriptional regulator n=1 Tax=Novosphingobium sediminis TaxID=707214 RepID=A0A512AG67_9SPHN|nr:TetR/AcrR family transcriptional regulator [Novosphingobium sediminis]GEN98691.1 TetR family transcriptional regulator [Novosphingobium sediminis]
MAAARHRQSIVDAAVRLFRQRGYAATGLNDLVKESGAPKGSLYHYFPEGKPAIAAAAVEEAGLRVLRTFEEVAARTTTTAELVVEHAHLLAGWMQASGFRDGCPITTILLELAPEDEKVAEAGRNAFAGRLALLRDRLIKDGYDAVSAENLALVCTNAVQGSLVMARIESSCAPIERTAAQLARMLESKA